MIRRLSLRRRLLAALATFALGAVLWPLLLANRLRHRRAAVHRILVLEPWGIGDLVLATGTLASMRRAYPAARISVLAKSYARALLLETGAVDDVIAYDFPWTAFRAKYSPARYRWRELGALVRALRQERFDLALNARADVRNNVLLALAGASRSVSLACGLGDFLVTDVVRSPGRDAHRVADWAAVTARALHQRDTPVAEPMLRVRRDEVGAARVRLGLGSRRAGPVVGIHPGARIAVRRWELARFATVADALVDEFGARIILFAEPDGYGAGIPMRHPVSVVRGSLAEMMAASSCCDMVICNDSGPMHVVAALGVPLVAVFGPTRREWFGPRGNGHRVVQVDDVACRPCFDVCTFAEPHCMTGVSTEHVLASARATLDARRGTPATASAS